MNEGNYGFLDEFLVFISRVEFIFFPEAGSQSALVGLIESIQPYAQMLAAIFTLVLVGYKVISYFINPSSNMDPNILIKPILILAALALYVPAVKLLLFRPAELLTSITFSGVSQITGTNGTTDFEHVFYDVMNADSGEEMESMLMFSPILEVIHLIIYIVGLVVAVYIQIRYVIMKGIYFALGMFALPLCLIPGNFEVLKNWFFGFLSVLLWIPVLRLLQAIMITLNNTVTLGGEWSFSGSPLVLIVLKLIMILCILQVPKYANILVSGAGDGDGSGYLMVIGRDFYYSARSRMFSRSRSEGQKRNQQTGK